MIKISASSAARARACPPSVRMDGLSVATTPLPALGSALHYMMMMAIAHQQRIEAAQAASRFACDAMELEQLAAQAWRAWQQLKDYFFWDDGSRPRCEVPLSKSYQDLVLTGHVDVLGLAPANRQIRIGDWKSSWQEEEHGDQARAYAWLALENYPDYDEVWVAVIRPRQGSYEARAYHRDELHAWIEGLNDRLTGRGSEEYHVGDQCLRCPRAATCPAVASLMRQALCDPNWSELPDQASEPKQYEQIHTHIRILEHQCEAARKALKAKVAASGGKIGSLVITEQKRETIRLTAEAWNVMRQVARDFDEIAKIARISTMELKKQVMAQTPRGKKTEAWEAVLESLREAGAVETNCVNQLEMRRTKDEPAITSDAAGAISDLHHGAALPDRPCEVMRHLA